MPLIRTGLGVLPALLCFALFGYAPFGGFSRGMGWLQNAFRACLKTGEWRDAGPRIPGRQEPAALQ